MRLHRLQLEFRMDLAAQHPGTVENLADFDVGLVRSLARDARAVARQALLVLAVNS